MQTSGAMRREIAKLYPPSLRATGSRECAPDDRLREAIHCHLVHGKMDCFASLAMTRRGCGVLDRPVEPGDDTGVV